MTREAFSSNLDTSFSSRSFFENNRKHRDPFITSPLDGEESNFAGSEQGERSSSFDAILGTMEFDAHQELLSGDLLPNEEFDLLAGNTATGEQHDSDQDFAVGANEGGDADI
jgi:hypothetical protein